MDILRLIFPFNGENKKISSLLFFARVIFALLLAHHGFEKLSNFNKMSAQFPDPLHFGSELSLSLAIFGEFVCSIAVIIGFLTRLALIPMAFTMFIAFFVTHGGSIAVGELAFVYLIIFLLLIVSGPGKYSIDAWIANKLKK